MLVKGDRKKGESARGVIVVAVCGRSCVVLNHAMLAGDLTGQTDSRREGGIAQLLPVVQGPSLAQREAQRVGAEEGEVGEYLHPDRHPGGDSTWAPDPSRPSHPLALSS